MRKIIENFSQNLEFIKSTPVKTILITITVLFITNTFVTQPFLTAKSTTLNFMGIFGTIFIYLFMLNYLWSNLFGKKI